MRLVLDDEVDHQLLYGRQDENLRHLEEVFRVSIGARGNIVIIEGNPGAQETVSKVLRTLEQIVVQGRPLRQGDIDAAIQHFSREEPAEEFHRNMSGGVALKRKRINPRSTRQREYLEAINKYDLTFGIGPAGTGKTYLAVATACLAIQNGEVDRIILTRPAVEAGEKLGFLPGDLSDKVDPYLRPLYDALYDMLGADRVLRNLDRGVIEVAPLAFMRGRTLNNAFIILDEAQNTTAEQMKMFLTRLGNSSKAVITGDITQIDLPPKSVSGMVQAVKILKGVPGIGIIEFGRKDIVRHPLVQSILDAYDHHLPQPHSQEEERSGLKETATPANVTSWPN